MDTGIIILPTQTMHKRIGEINQNISKSSLICIGNDPPKIGHLMNDLGLETLILPCRVVASTRAFPMDESGGKAE